MFHLRVRSWEGLNNQPYISPPWQATIAASSSNPIVGLDTLAANQNVAFTIQHQLIPGERVIHGYLAMNLKQSGEEVATDFVQLFDADASHRFGFGALGWASKINATSPYVGVIDMGSYLDKMQSGAVNVQVSDDVAMDWALYSVTVATPKSDPTGPRVYLDGGNVLVNTFLPAVATLQNGGPAPSQLTIAQGGRLTVNDDFTQTNNGALTVQIGGRNDGQYGKLTAGDMAILNGQLNIQLINGFTPSAGDQFQILTATGGLAGTGFDTDAIFSDLSGNAVWELVYGASSVTARAVSGSMFGDLNGDNQLTAADWNIYINNALTNLSGLTTSQAYFRGDLNHDGKNDLFDMILFFDAYDAAHGAGSVSQLLAEVPEPGHNMLVLFIAGLKCSARRARTGVSL